MVITALAGCPGEGCSGKKKGELPDLSRASDGFTEPVAAAYELQLTHLTAQANSSGEISLAARRRGGRLVHARLSAHGFTVEEVAPGALPGRPALGVTAAGAPVIAAIIAPTIGETARIPPPPEAPRTAVEGEGALRLLYRRGEELWRGEALADRALEPQLAVASDDTLHLCFLQPYARGLFQVVHLRVKGAAVARETVGIGRRAPPSLILQDDLPWIAHATAEGSLAVKVGKEGGGFDDFPVASGGKKTQVPAFALAPGAGEAAELAMLTPAAGTASDGAATWALHLRHLKNPVPVKEARQGLAPRGTFPKGSVGLLQAAGEGRWLLQAATTAYTGGPAKKSARRHPALREANLLDAGPFALIGLDADGRLRVSR